MLTHFFCVVIILVSTEGYSDPPLRPTTMSKPWPMEPKPQKSGPAFTAQDKAACLGNVACRLAYQSDANRGEYEKAQARKANWVDGVSTPTDPIQSFFLNTYKPRWVKMAKKLIEMQRRARNKPRKAGFSDIFGTKGAEKLFAEIEDKTGVRDRTPPVREPPTVSKTHTSQRLRAMKSSPKAATAQVTKQRKKSLPMSQSAPDRSAPGGLSSPARASVWRDLNDGNEELDESVPDDGTLMEVEADPLAGHLERQLQRLASSEEDQEEDEDSSALGGFYGDGPAKADTQKHVTALETGSAISSVKRTVMPRADSMTRAMQAKMKTAAAAEGAKESWQDTIDADHSATKIHKQVAKSKVHKKAAKHQHHKAAKHQHH